MLIMVEEKNNLIQEFLSYILMLNCEEKKIVLCTTKNNNLQTLVLSEKKILNETKNHNPSLPPLQVKWSVPYGISVSLHVPDTTIPVYEPQSPLS
jgi:hypothetical protein